MTKPTLGDAFSAELMPGETIEWTGQPNSSAFFHREDWFAIPFGIVWGGGSLIFVLAALRLVDIGEKGPGNPFEIAMAALFTAVGQYLIWGRIVHRRWKKMRTFYALTNRRALIVEYGFRRRISSSAMWDGLTLIHKRVHHGGVGSICFGGPVTDEWTFGRNNSPRHPTFDDVDNADMLYQTILRLQHHVRRPVGF